jgi:hypothetical protein
MRFGLLRLSFAVSTRFRRPRCSRGHVGVRDTCPDLAPAETDTRVTR